MKVLVTGGRDYQNRARVFEVLDGIDRERPIDILVHGACGVDRYKSRGQRALAEWRKLRGADRWADEWCAERLWQSWPEECVRVRRYPAIWVNERGMYWKHAGTDRNIEMLEKEHRPAEPIDLVVAFPGGAGTRHMCEIARAAGVAVLEVADRPAAPQTLVFDWFRRLRVD